MAQKECKNCSREPTTTNQEFSLRLLDYLWGHTVLYNLLHVQDVIMEFNPTFHRTPMENCNKTLTELALLLMEPVQKHKYK